MNNERNEYLKDRWQYKAKKYPRYRSPGGDMRERVLAAVASSGIDIKDKNVIDIGCGTGVYTIALAKLARRVTGVDISTEMTDIMLEDARAEGLSNIETIVVPWDSFDRQGKKWDIAVSTMSPALETEEDLKKAEDCASEAFIYLGWGGKRENRFVMAVAEKFGLSPRIFRNSEKVKNWLSSTGKSYSSTVFDEVRTKETPLKDAMEFCRDECSNYIMDVTDEMINECLPAFTQPDGTVRFTISSQLELITWRV